MSAPKKIRDDGLPGGIEQHGAGYRHRTRASPTSNKRFWRWFETLAEVLADREACSKALKAGHAIPPMPARGTVLSPHTTLYDWMRYRWFPEYEQRGHKSETRLTREADLRNHLAPAEWMHRAISVVQYDRDVIVEWFREQVRRHDRGEGGFSRDKASTLRWMVEDAFKMAVDRPRLTGVSNNPARKITFAPARPARSQSGDVVNVIGRRTGKRQRQGSQLRALTPSMAAQVLEGMLLVDYVPFLLMYVMGLRIGEAFGLRLCDIDLRDDQPGALRVRQQYGHWRDKDDLNHDGAPKHKWIKPWVKTQAANRDLFLPDGLRDFIRAWLPLAYPTSQPEPTDLLNRAPWGRDPGLVTQAGLNAGFRGRLARTAEELGISIIVDEERQDSADLLPHDLRKSLSALLSKAVRDGRIQPESRSSFLGHKHEGTWDESDVTARVYTPVTEAGLREIANVQQEWLEAEFDLQSLLSACDKPLITAVAAAERLGVNQTTINRYVHLGILPRYRHPADATKRHWHLVDDVDALGRLLELRPKETPNAPLVWCFDSKQLEPETDAERSMIERVVASDHIPGAVSGVDLARQLGLTANELKKWMPNLDRIESPGPSSRTAHFTLESAERLRQLLAGIKSGTLITASQAAVIAGVRTYTVTETLRLHPERLDHVRWGRTCYISAASVRALWVIPMGFAPLPATAAKYGTSPRRLRQLLRDEDILLRGTGVPILVREEAVKAHFACGELQVQTPKGADDGLVTLAKLRKELGCSYEFVLNIIGAGQIVTSSTGAPATSSACADQVRAANVARLSRVAYLASGPDGHMPLPRAAEALSVHPGTVLSWAKDDVVTIDGFHFVPTEWVESTRAQKGPRVSAAELRHGAPPGWLRIEDAADRLGLSVTYVRSLVRSNEVDYWRTAGRVLISSASIDEVAAKRRKAG
jgi:excisionase family DNA binding protein